MRSLRAILAVVLVMSVASPLSAGGPLFYGRTANTFPSRHLVVQAPGAVLLGLWCNPNLGTQQACMASREASVGRTIALHTAYRQFTGLANASSDNVFQDDINNGRIPNISWKCSVQSGSTVTTYPFQDIANGLYDSIIDAAASSIASLPLVNGQPQRVIIRPSWEFNLNIGNPGLSSTSAGPNGNDCYKLPATVADQAKQYIAYFQHLVNRFYADGVRNVTWEWCPGAAALDYQGKPVDSFYPGDAYVDIVAGDTYDKLAQPTRGFVGIWQTFWNKESWRGKPLAITETGEANNATDAFTQPQFFSDATTALQPGGAFYVDETHRIAFFSYFDSDVARQWSLADIGTDDATANGLTAFTTMANLSFFNPSIPP